MEQSATMTLNLSRLPANPRWIQKTQILPLALLYTHNKLSPKIGGGEETWGGGEMGAAAQAIEKQALGEDSATGILLFFPITLPKEIRSLCQSAHTCACIRTTSPPLKVLGTQEGEANVFLSGHTH